MNRRRFLITSAGVGVAGAVSAPSILRRMAYALDPTGDKILVVVNLEGGNDGLATFIPQWVNVDRDRGSVLPASRINWTSQYKLHGSLAPLADLFTMEGNGAVLQTIGLPNKRVNLSHQTAEFANLTGLDIPSTAPNAGSIAGEGTERGVAAKAYDAAGRPAVDPMFMCECGTAHSSAFFRGMTGFAVPSIREAADAIIQTPERIDRAATLDAIAEMEKVLYTDPVLNAIQAAMTSARLASGVVENSQTLPGAVYPAGNPGRGLAQISRMIRAGAGTRLYFTDQGGYDTHSSQLRDQSILLATLSQCLRLFADEMKQAGLWNRVLVLVTTEFGRRYAANGSVGTDHGGGNLWFALGGAVQGGIYGPQPNLDVDALGFQGSLIPLVDSRSVWATALAWLGGDPRLLFGLDVFNRVLAAEMPLLAITGAAVPTPSPTPSPTPTATPGTPIPTPIPEETPIFETKTQYWRDGRITHIKE